MNTYTVAVGGKTYPAPSKGLSQEFEKIATELTQPLLLTSAKKSYMYPRFGELVQYFMDSFEKTKRFLGFIIRSNCTGNDAKRIRRRKAIFDRHLEKITFSPPAALTAETAIRPEKEQLAVLNNSIEMNVKALAHFFCTTLDQLVLANQVGLIEWFSSDVVRFHYFLNDFDKSESILNRMHTKNGRDHEETWDRHTVRTETCERHQHDLVDAKAHPLGPKQPYVPYRVERLIEEIPNLFRPYFHIVTGQQIYEHVVKDTRRETTVESEGRKWTEPPPPPPVQSPPRSVYRYDPALVIGEYVVAGWDEDEEKHAKGLEAMCQKYVRAYSQKELHPKLRQGWYQQNTAVDW